MMERPFQGAIPIRGGDGQVLWSCREQLEMIPNVQVIPWEELEKPAEAPEIVATVAEEEKTDTVSMRVAKVLAEAEADLASVTRDDLVAVSRYLGINPPDKGYWSTKPAIYKRIKKKLDERAG